MSFADENEAGLDPEDKQKPEVAYTKDILEEGQGDLTEKQKKVKSAR